MAVDPRLFAGDLKSPRRVLAVGVATLVLLVGGFALLINTNEAAARRSLDDRFESRAALTAAFARNYIDDIATRERLQAEHLLAAPTVDRSTFEQVVQSLGFEAAVLLDGQGRLLQVWPSQPKLLGQDMTAKYAHLRTAVAGKVAVSEVVPSAAAHIPVAAVAVPYQSAAGRRVLSGAFSPTTTPLGAYFLSAIPIVGGSGYLVDRSGHVLTNAQKVDSLPSQLRSHALGLTRFSTGDGTVTAAIAQVKNVSWRVVLTMPSSQLYAPINQSRWAPWGLLGLLGLVGMLVLVLFVRLGRARTEATETARTDALTGLPNRRAMDEMLTRAVARSTRHREHLAVLMIDLDHFKSVNDNHGHKVGDLVLRAAAEAIQAVGRDEDVSGRWGGEEFLVILQMTGLDGAAIAAERLRAAVAGVEVVVGRQEMTVTASIGVAELDSSESSETLLRVADDALYRAKAAGRNAVEVARPVGAA